MHSYHIYLPWHFPAMAFNVRSIFFGHLKRKRHYENNLKDMTNVSIKLKYLTQHELEYKTVR